MADPIGLINAGAGPIQRDRGAGGARAVPPGSPSFKDVLLNEIGEANRAQQEANRAIEDLAVGRRTDLEGVILATQKADTAFRMLQAMRNKVVEAYEEIKQIRV